MRTQGSLSEALDEVDKARQQFVLTIADALRLRVLLDWIIAHAARLRE